MPGQTDLWIQQLLTSALLNSSQKTGSNRTALVHKSRLGQTGACRISFYRTRCEMGFSRWVLRLSTEQAIRASTFCVGRVRARRREPIRVL